MTASDAKTNPHNATRFEGESARLQIRLESAMATSNTDAMELALDAGADPTAYPIGPMNGKWFGQADGLRGVIKSLGLTPDRCTLLGNVALSFPSADTDRAFDALVRNARPSAGTSCDGLWRTIPSAFVDQKGEEVDLLKLFFDRENFGRMSEIRPSTACVDMLTVLLDKLDRTSKHVRWEMRDAAAAALARSMDSSEYFRRQGLLDERHTAAYDAFGILSTAGATLTDDLTNKTIRIMFGQNHVHVPLLTAASMPHPGATIRRWATHELMENLIRGEARIDARSMGGKTALMCAALQGDVKAVAILLENGADAALKDNRKWTAESYARQSQSDDGPQTLALLQAHKAQSTIVSVRARAASLRGGSS